jgi:hypothetical protein
MLFRQVVRAILLTVTIVLLPVFVCAQSGTSAITGVVKDSSGAAVPGAHVRIANLLNRASFNIPGFTPGAADFGVISSARPARTVQLGTPLSL